MATLSTNEAFLRYIQNLSELDFTKRILIPLFKSLGYGRVDYYGGNDEEGKDIVCWRKSEIGDVELTVVQVKKFKLNRKSASDKSIHAVMYQLSQAAEKRLPFLDGCSYRPEIVYFVTPYAINTKTLAAKFESYESLRAQRVRIVDGLRLISLVSEKLPSLFDEIEGTSFQVSRAISSELTNKTLINALEYASHRGANERQGVENFYTDIDFSLFWPIARRMFSSELVPIATTVSLSREDCIQILNLNSISQKNFGCSFLRDLELLDSRFRQYEARHSRWEKRTEEIADKHLKLLEQCEALEGRIRAEGREYAVVLALMKTKEPRYIAADVDVVAEKRLGTKDIPGGVADSGREVLDLSREYADVLVQMDEIRREMVISNNEEPRLDLPAVIDASKLVEFLIGRRAEIETRIDAFNRRAPSAGSLREFLIGCSAFFEVSGKILADSRIAHSVGMGRGALQRSFTARLALSPHQVFDTGINIALLGEAGAGKTTSLQMYAYRSIHSSERRLAIYAPLAALLRVWCGKAQLPFGDSGVPLLEDGLYIYLRSLGFHGGKEELIEELSRIGGILLLDGVDEVFKSFSWIIDSISAFSGRRRDVQIIVSARATGNYLEPLGFVKIALLPFTNEQRNRFVKRWFVEEDDARVTRILNHLEAAPHVAEIIKNPLLATILCVLAENDVPLPTSEVRLYDERLRLLLGQYDLHKKVRRIETHSSNLHLVARKVAFLLHFGEKRDEELSALFGMAEASGMPEDQCRRAVEELIDPCNILVPADEGRRFGFGHLRYQEHLAAQEIAGNRGIPIVPLMEQEWWIGVFVLYAQMNQGIEFIVKQLARAGRVGPVVKTLLEMVGTLLPNDRSDATKPFGAESVFDGLFEPDVPE